MGREKRKLSITGIYHVYFRGVNHCHLFEENPDYEKFLSILNSTKAKIEFELFGYCLMSNHVHLAIHENTSGDIAKIMRTMLATYAWWFNRKYQRIGSLITDRYKSECVNDDEHLLAVIRYIHQNPLKAGIVGKISDYEWSSYNEYMDDAGDNVDLDYVFSVISPNRDDAMKEFKGFHAAATEEEYVPSDLRRRSESDIRRKIVALLDGKEPGEIVRYGKDERNAVIRILRDSGLSIRQIERATGVSRGVIAKC